MTALAPCSIARETATVMPRSLNAPVGFMPSDLTHTSAPVRRDSAGAGSRGVPPSPRVTTVEASVTPSLSAYSRSTPRQTCAMSVSFHAQDRDDALDDAARGEPVDRLAQVLLQGLVGADHEAGDGVARRLGREAAVAGHRLAAHRLLDGRDRDVTLAEDAGDRREHAGLVVDLERD